MFSINILRSIFYIRRKGKKMKQFTLPYFLSILLITALLAVSCSSKTASTSPVSTVVTTSSVTTTVAPSNTISTAAKSGIGTYLVDNSGLTLYWVALDSIGKSNIAGSTLTIWPVFYTGTVTVPSSLNASDFGSIQRSDGKMQTTYKGWPLYHYYQDLASGNTYGQGIDGVWFAAGPSSSGPTSSITTTTSTAAVTTTTSTTGVTTTTTTVPYSY
jgi:predicted lipoprotein with Yx(FWY)xxD motif